MFKSRCRICGHSMDWSYPWEGKMMLPTHLAKGIEENCIPKDNLEYLEYLYERKIGGSGGQQP